jgi:TRAP-type C4-dicarboxylate transport system permease small subunit
MNDTVTTPGHPDLGGPPLPTWLETGKRFLAVIGRIELTLAVIALVIVVVLSAAQAILRYTIGASLWWAQEVAQLTIVVAYFFGVSYLFKIRQYILVEFLSLKFSIRIQLMLYVFAQILTIAFTATVFVLLIRFAPMLLQMTTPTLGLPELLRSLPLAIASTMMVVTSLYYLAFGLWALATNVPGTSLDEIEQMALIGWMPEELDS